MRNKIAVLLILTGLILCLSGCSPSGQKELPSDSVLQRAKTVHDVSAYMNLNEDQKIYSECKNDKALHFYFDMLNSEQYIKVNHKGKDYLLFWYVYYSYTDYVKEIVSVDKTFRGKELRIDVKDKKEDFEEVSRGCFASGSRFRMIISLDQDVDLIYLSGKPVAEFNGGKIKVGKNEGIVDKELNFLVPPIYEGIYDLETFEESNCPKYYRVYKKGSGNGVLDNNYKPVLSTSYGNVYYINENKFIVGTSNRDAKLDEIYIVDAKENILKKMPGFLCAKDQISLHCAKDQIRICDPSYNDIWGTGIVDTDLNIIIKPVYQEIYWDKSTYKVEDYDGRTKHFDKQGNEK